MTNTWPGWQNAGLIGEGSFGRVYKIRREEFGQTYEAALKVITIPATQAEVRTAFEEGMDEVSVTQYFRSFVEEIVAEFALMSKLKGNSNIVSYEDHMVVEHEDGIGWDILIRMELLTALPEYAAKHPLTEADVIRLGTDLSQALTLCRRQGIIHRDIKPENIFVSRDGDFKLGDFGVARVAEKTVSAMSRKGTYNYMAPEVYKGEEYGYAADLYSLGLVLYRFLNDNRTPFLPPYPQPIQYSDKERALNRRIGGEPLPPPAHGSEELKRVVLKACGFRPEERYKSAEELGRALTGLSKGTAKPSEETVSDKEDVLEKTLSVFPDRSSGQKKNPAEESFREGKEIPVGKKTKKSWLLLLAGFLAVMAAVIAIRGGLSSGQTSGAGGQSRGQAGVSAQQPPSGERNSNGGGEENESQASRPEQTSALQDEAQEETQEMPAEETDTVIRIGILADTEVVRLAFQHLSEKYPSIEREGKTYDVELVFSDLYEGNDDMDYEELDELSTQYGEMQAAKFKDAGCRIVIDACRETELETSRALGPILTEAGIAVLGDSEYEDDTYFRMAPTRGAWENMDDFIGALGAALAEGKPVLTTSGAVNAIEAAKGTAVRLDVEANTSDDMTEKYREFLEGQGDLSQIGAVVLCSGQGYKLESLCAELQDMGYGAIPVIVNSVYYYEDAREAGLTNVFFAVEDFYWTYLQAADTFGPEFRAWIDADANRAALYDEAINWEDWRGTVDDRDYVANDMLMTALQALEAGGDVRQALWTGTFTGVLGTYRFKLDGEGCLSEYISYPVYHYDSDSFIDFTMP